MPHLKYNVGAYNVGAAERWVDHLNRALHLHCPTVELTVETQEAIVQSQALIAEVDDLLAMNAIRPGWLWPRTAVAGEPAAGIAPSPD